MEELSKEQKIYYITAVSTAILAFLAFAGLMFALIELTKNKILDFKISVLILIFIYLTLSYIIGRIKGWLNK